MGGYAGESPFASFLSWEEEKETRERREVKRPDAFIGFLRQAYMLLLLLEYARVMADDREAMSYRP